MKRYYYFANRWGEALILPSMRIPPHLVAALDRAGFSGPLRWPK